METAIGLVACSRQLQILPTTTPHPGPCSYHLMVRDDCGTRGNSKKLKISYRDVKKNCFPHRSISTWNEVDEEIVCAKLIHEFKDKLDKKRYGDGTVRA